MKRILVVLLAAITLGGFEARADEGMWLPMLIKRLNYKDMQEHGLQLTPEEIYSVNNSSLKDAIVALGGGFCTGEIISSQGLMLTNHHCGYGDIQKLSTPEDNILKNGFWAATKADEKPASFSVWFLDKMEDVTDKVLKGVKDGMKEGERNAIIEKNKAAIMAEQDENKTVQVKSFYHGNEYYMFIYSVFEDVRLVGTPPESIGKFGGDTDNWMWPRHTGDFSMFRVYANKDNEPAPYSEDNVPYKPKHHLPVSLKGVEKDDFAMIMGYPGSTDRYLTSFGVTEAVNIEQPARVKIRRKKLDIMEEGMNANPDVRLQYASKHAGVANYWKYFLGQSKQLVQNKVYDKKKAIENDYLKWAKADKKRQDKYGNALNLVEDYYKSGKEFVKPNVYFEEAIIQGPEVFLLLFSNFGFNSELGQLLSMEDPDEDKIEDALEKVEENIDEYFKDYNAKIDENLLAAMLEMYYNDVDPAYHPEILTEIHDKYKGDFAKFAAKYFKKSPFANKEDMEDFIDDFSKKDLEKDMAYQLVNEFVQTYVQQIIIPSQTLNTKYERGMRLFVDGLRQMNEGKKVYAADANSTMRLTYGNVLPYSGNDAINYHYITTLEGVMQKRVITDNELHEFYVEPKLIDLYNKKDYGQYALPNGKLPVGFLTNNDITGGNSGSPVINGKGELIGTAFDGNWEAMSGDIYFEPNLQRTISVDIRYTLFIIDKFGGAKHIVDEMTLVK